MVDNIMTSGQKRSKLKNNGEEDPIVVIQRLLNIFRQLHVMNDEQKASFNELILKQPAEIRHMCAVLPGGSLLQEYVDDLEEQTGQSSNTGFDIAAQTSANNSQNNILAAAIEQNQTTAVSAAPTVQVVDNGMSRELQKQITLIMQELQETKKDLAKVNQQAQASALAQAAQGAGSGQPATQPIVMPVGTGQTTLTTDENFAKEIASAVTSAFNMAEESRKKETKELAKSITESQQIICRETQELTKSLAESQKQISKETQELTKTLAESQIQMTQQLISELAQRPVTQGDIPIYSPPSAPAEKSANGANTVYVQGADTREITRAITESQLEMAKMFLQHNAISANAQNNTANNIQINNAPTPAVNTEEIISSIIKAQSRLFQEMSQTQTKELSSVIASALKESQQISTKSMIEALRETQNSSTKTMVETLKAFQKENLKFFEKQAKMMPKQTIVQAVAPAGVAAGDAAPVMYSEADTAGNEENASKTSYIKSVLTKNFSKLMHHSGEETFSTDTDVLVEDANDFTDTAAVESELFSAEASSEETGNTAAEVSFSESKEVLEKQSENTLQETEIEISASGDNFDIVDDENILPEIVGEEDNNVADREENPEQNFDGPTKKKRKKKKKKKRNTNENSAFSFLGDDVFSAATNVNPENATPAENQNLEPDTSLFDLDIPDTETSAKNTSSQISSLDMSLFDQDEPTQNISAEEYAIDDDTKTESVQDEQILADNNTDLSIADEAAEENISEATSEPVQERKHSSFLPDTTSTDDIYSLYNDRQLISENEMPVNLNTTPEETTSEIEEDSSEWTWEYEEADENGDTSAEALAADENSDGEWEWEYEEVDESGDTSAEALAADENSDGEWEWEYEEVDESGDTSAETLAADENSDGEWEWEYEEVDEPDTANEVGAIFLNKEDNSTLISDNGEETDYNRNKTDDPYAGETQEDQAALEFSSLQSGSLYYQADIKARQSKAPAVLRAEPDGNEEIIIPDGGNEENSFDPYTPNSGLK